MSIPSYSNPCIVSASTSLTPSSTVYLIGVSDTTKGLLEVNTIDLSNLSNPHITLSIINSNPFQWSNTAPKMCSNYPGYHPPQTSPFNGAIHIQQFGVGWSNDANVYPSIGKMEQPSQFDEVSFPDPKMYATVGNAGSSRFVMAMTNTTYIWLGLRFNATDSQLSYMDSELKVSPVGTPFLAVGTYIATARVPSRGNAIVFDSTRSGTIYNTTGSDTTATARESALTLSAPRAVSMRDVTFTTDAIPLSSEGGAYILDKAYDGTTAIYYINPSQSATLQRVITSGQSPPFVKSMVGTVTPSQIILYSIQTDGPIFTVFDLASKAWTGSSAVTPGAPATIPTTNPGDGTAIPSNGNGSGRLDPTGSKVSPGEIVGSVIIASILIALGVYFFIRNRRRRSLLSSSSSTHSGGDNAKSETAPLYTVAAAQDDSTAYAITVDAQYPPPPSSSIIAYPLPPRSSMPPRDPQLTPVADMFYPPPPSGSTAIRNAQSPLWKSLAFDFIPKTPPGPELHYSESWGEYADSDSKHNSNNNSKDVYSMFGVSHGASDARLLFVDDPYDKQPYSPSSPTRISTDTAVGTPQLHDRSQQQLEQEPEPTCPSSPLVSSAMTMTHPSSEIDGVTIADDSSVVTSSCPDPIYSKPPVIQGP